MDGNKVNRSAGHLIKEPWPRVMLSGQTHMPTEQTEW